MLDFDNRFVRELPGDPETGPRLRQVRGALWSSVAPEPVAAPRLLAYSRDMAARLGFSDDEVASPAFADVSLQQVQALNPLVAAMVR